MINTSHSFSTLEVLQEVPIPSQMTVFGLKVARDPVKKSKNSRMVVNQFTLAKPGSAVAPIHPDAADAVHVVDELEVSAVQN